MKIKMIILALGLLIMTISCTPQKRLNRFHKNHPELFDKKLDTIHIIDSVKYTSPAINVDTATHIKYLYDTITLSKDGLTTQVWIYKDSVFITSQIAPKTVYIPYYKSVPYVKYEAKVENVWFKNLIWVLVLLIVIYLVYRIFIKVKSSI